ncbi:GNAT family N-acetyltransferase [Henriciella litoralis]|uniref:GNAT family N-acetyltransferase n=1 Tax=Henriciella litoralis TaxID=568102 RepID=UPI0009FC24B0|nr:GNAT family N-acetyltransferase [Henriciella litoralis]
MDDAHFKIRLVHGLNEVDPDAWNALANPPGLEFDPFLSWEFLEAMESSGAATPHTGWSPHHLLIEWADQGLVGAMPLYLKTHSQGEFVFDHSWADAYERAGGHYYPKLLSAVPFTPVTGRRRLVRPGAPDDARISNALLAGAIQIAQQNDISSLHINFIEREDAADMDEAGLLIRTDQQFHWHNDGYESFDDFLAVLSSSKRKNLRKERAKAQEGLTFEHITGADITEAHWDAFYEFYVDTGSRKWGTPYLNRETFSLLGERMSEHLLLIFAMEDGEPIAGALNMIGGNRLLGRYWGTIDPRPMLHFETCYYQAIDFAIERGLKTVEAGAQGGHKLARGYVPETTYSAHWIGHEGLASAVEEYLERERLMVEQEAGFLRQRTPFKKDG